MNRFTSALLATGLTLGSTSAFAAATVNVAHFAPFADSLEDTTVDIAIDGEVALPGVAFKDFVLAVPFEAGTYTIDVLLAGTDIVAITDEFTLEDGNSYTLYAVGNGTTQDLELRALVDNTMMPDMGNLNVRIVHAAPFAADSAATEVSIRTAGGDLVNGLTGVPYNVDSGFFQIPAGTYDLKVASNDGSTNYIDPLPAELLAGADVTVFAVGDGIHQPLGIIALPVGELPTRTPVDNRSNGLWTLADASGYGFVLQPMPSQNRLVGKWYQPDENGNPTYFFFDSCLDDTNDQGEFECSTPGAFDGEMATTALYQCVGGSLDMSEMVECTDIGQIDFEILGCNDANATVRLGDDTVGTVYAAKQLTRPFPCVDPEPAAQ